MCIDYLWSDLKSNLYFSKVDSKSLSLFHLTLSALKCFQKWLENCQCKNKTKKKCLLTRSALRICELCYSLTAGKVVWYGFIPHKFVVWLLASLSLSLSSLLGNNPFVNAPDCLWCEASCQAAIEYSMKCPSIRRSVKLIPLVTVAEYPFCHLSNGARICLTQHCMCL